MGEENRGEEGVRTRDEKTGEEEGERRGVRGRREEEERGGEGKRG